MNREQTKYLMDKYELSLSKSLGQNFLIHEEKQDLIIACAELKSEDLALEIGPGIGALSSRIAAQCGRLIAVEIDAKVIPALEESLHGAPNVEILCQDAMTVDFAALCRQKQIEHPELRTLKVVANLPYNITTPIITKLILSLPQCERMVFTVQKEAANRIVSAPHSKEYGVLSVLAQAFSEAKIVDLISQDSFLPPPSVVSCILQLTRREKAFPDAKFLDVFYKVVRASFSQRRKTLLNSLGGSGMVPGGKTALEEILRDEDIPLQCRAEDLDYIRFETITKYIMERFHSSIASNS